MVVYLPFPPLAWGKGSGLGRALTLKVPLFRQRNRITTWIPVPYPVVRDIGELGAHGVVAIDRADDTDYPEVISIDLKHLLHQAGTFFFSRGLCDLLIQFNQVLDI